MIIGKIRALRPALTALALLALSSVCGAAVRLPAVLSDHMVVQRDKPVTVWGWADKGEAVAVRLAGRETKARAGADGSWRVVLDPVAAGGAPLEMSVRGERGPEVVVRDILVGEVWLCSGQSNMEWPVSALVSPLPEILRAVDPGLRLFLVPKRTADRPQPDVEAAWKPCAPEAVQPFSAVGYYFGSELRKALGVPVGLIESAWGGTRIEPWTPPAGFEAVPEVTSILNGVADQKAEYRKNLALALPDWEKWVRDSRKAIASGAELPARPKALVHPLDDPQAPTSLYNGMIHALVPFGLRGAIWYQGESNRNDGLLYEKKMEALIRGWRAVWGMDDLAFGYVQLAPYSYSYLRETPAGEVPDFLRLAHIWEAQLNTLRIPHTGMAVVTDITDLNDIHPRNKRDVGARLALWARAKVYGESGLVYSGPIYKTMAVAGDKATLSFDHAGGGLIATDGQSLKWFEVAGADKIFHKADAEIVGDTVVVRSARVAAPAAVRFGWHQLAVPNLANKEGLPASPFRTDRW